MATTTPPSVEAETAPANNGGLNAFTDLWQHIISPGASRATMSTLNKTLVALILTLLSMLTVGGLSDNIHVWIFVTLSVLLMLSINWFVYSVQGGPVEPSPVDTTATSEDASKKDD
eukprot:GILK01009702.1.p1 GENE.GILK01009702.1~~GILK01009702.1.p1  ORF type:complete len:116 (+),score=12.57 GILK01009702.1:44-391(+)